MDKVAVYSGTSNVYPQMYTALKSLLINNKMDRVYLFIDTDEFPYPVPDCVKCIDVSDQPFFPADSANSTSRWTYMDLLRCALGLILQDEECVLWFDIDTIVDGDISELFNMDMTGYYFAGVPEFYKSTSFFRYINTGVCMHNLSLLRKMNKEHEMISFLNAYHFDYPGQDAINLLGQGRIKTIDSEFNMNMCVNPCHRPKIIHFTDLKIPEYTQNWAYKKYEAMQIPMGGDSECS